MSGNEDRLEFHLKALEAEGLSAEDYLSHHPEAAPLAPLLKSADTIRDIAASMTVAPGETIRASFLDAVEAAAADARRKTVDGTLMRLRNLWSRIRLRQAAALAAAALMLSAGAASGRSLPTSPLYPVKRTIESGRLSLSLSAAAKARLHVGIARERLSEIRSLINGQDLTHIGELSREVDRNLEAAKKLSKNLKRSDREEIDRLIKELNNELQVLLEHLEGGAGSKLLPPISPSAPESNSDRRDEDEINEDGGDDGTEDEKTGGEDNDGVPPEQKGDDDPDKSNDSGSDSGQNPDSPDSHSDSDSSKSGSGNSPDSD